MRKETNRVTLTEARIQKLPIPAEKYYRVWDADVPALVLVVYQSSKKQYKHYYNRNGQRVWFHIGTAGNLPLEEARDTVRDNTTKMNRDPNYDPQAERKANRSQGTFAEMAEAYMVGAGEQAQYKTRKHLLPRWVDCQPTQSGVKT